MNFTNVPTFFTRGLNPKALLVRTNYVCLELESFDFLKFPADSEAPKRGSETVFMRSGQMELKTDLLSKPQDRQHEPEQHPTGPAKTVVQQFEAQAALSPEAIALICNGRTLTYQKLNAKANQLAHFLRHQGVTNEAPIALYFYRSLEMLVAIWGVLKAGGVYVPIDPSHPTERTSHVLQDTQVRWILTESQLADRLAKGTAIALDQLDLATFPTHNLPSSPALRQLAYCLYTSGSTGLPKGVEIEHWSLANYVQWAQQQYTHGEALAFPLFSPLTFDLTVTSIYVPLLSGGQIVIYPEDKAAIDLSLQRIFQDNAVDVVKLTPSHLHLVQGRKIGSRVRALILGGEDFKTSLASDICRWAKADRGNKSSEIVIFNEYGPTEATVGCMIEQFDSTLETAELPASVPIGRPAAGASIYLLDESLKATPQGDVGEIFIGGPGLARGYLNRPELTAARFIWREGERLYRTGDLGHWGENGALMYLGRCDRQVKLNGIRIELGEIEAALGSHPQIKTCVVTVAQQTDQLVAYCVSKEASQGEQPVTAATLRDFLARRLPSNMRPTYFVSLKRMPLTANGKVDLAALPAPQTDCQVEIESFAAPQTPLEKTLAEIWQQVLSVSLLGTNDNFFDLGGDSIKAIQIAAQISELGLAVSPNQIFQHATIYELAAVVTPTADGALDGEDDLSSASLLATALAKLKKKQKSQLSQLLSISAAEANPWHNVADVYPLTPAQSGMLFHTLANPQTGVYLNQFICRLSGDVQPERLQQAWQQTVARHPVLRTAVVWEGLDEPLQVVQNQVALPWQQLDWRSLTATEQKTQLAKYLQNDREGFDLTRAPAFRLALMRLSEESYRFVCSSHHLLYDGWSLQLIWQDMLSQYAALSKGASDLVGLAGSASEKPPLRSFRDYVMWQQHQDLSAAEVFWKQQLQNLSEPTPLPTASLSSSANQSYQQQSKQINAALLERLTALARQYRLTMNTLIQGAWALLLDHYSDRGRRALTDHTQVTYGSVFSGRPASFRGIEKMVGLFINTLPVSVSIDPQQSLLSWLQDRQQQLLEIREYEATPLSAIQRWSNLPHGSSLFESIVAFENLTAAAMPETGFDTHDIQYVERSNYPLALLVFPNGDPKGGLFSGSEGCLDLRLLYDTSRFEAAAISRLLDHLEQLLVGFASKPQCRLGDLPRLTLADQSFQVSNKLQVSYPHHLCIHQLIEAQVLLSPQAAAIVFAGHSLTYAQLNQQANQLAHCLRSHGVAPGKRVALCLHRSLMMAVGILAILKAGAAYVPLDPTYPQSRLDYCLQAAEPHLVITQQSVLSNQSVPLLHLDKEVFSSYPTTNLENLAQPQDLAYVIYTSGSTGRPKGVMVTHQNLVHSTTARFQVYDQPVERFLLLSSIAFDSSIAGLFWTLCQGGMLVLSPMHIEQDLQRLAELINRHQITHTLCIPTLYHLLLESVNLSHLATLKTVIVAGEACSRTLAQQHYRYLPAADLYNEYGPTEGSVWCSAYRVPAELPPGPISIGKPIPNIQIHLLNKALQPVPVGAVGEIYISGDGVTPGYLNQSEKTAAAYVEASCFAGSRGYKTGDLGRYRSDGSLEWLGRCDRQLKIRGYRIELGEIEDVLRSHKLVKEATVAAQSPPCKDSANSIDDLVAALESLPFEQAEALLTSVETIATWESH